MKTVLLAPLPPPAGGIALWTKRMTEVTLPHGWEIEVVNEAIIGNRSLFGNNTKRNLFTEFKRLVNIWKDLKEKIKDHEVKIVHSCIPAEPLSMIREYRCAKIAHKYNKRFVVHFRCTVPIICNSKIKIFLFKKFIKQCDGFILLNQESVNFLKKYTNKPLFLIPNFVSKKEIFKDKKINNMVGTALYVGGCVPSKGCLTIIDIAKNNPNIEFRLVGAANKKTIEYANGLSNIVFVGEVSKKEIKRELLNADIFLFLSYFAGEGFSNSLVEAMAAGLPCIVSDWAANRDMIEDKGGIVVPPNDSKKAVNAFKDLQSKKKRELCSAFNISKVASQYVDEIVIKKYVECYEELLKNES